MLGVAESSAADWWTVGLTAVAGVVAICLLAFEMWQVKQERRRRIAAEEKGARDLALERARRVVAWIEPIRWHMNREGVVQEMPGGWKLVVSNDTDDTISNWRAQVIKPSATGRDELIVEAAVLQHGVISPRSRFEADVTDADPSRLPIPHDDLEAIVRLEWVDREDQAWHSRGAAGPHQLAQVEGRWAVSHPEVAARTSLMTAVNRPSLVVRRLN